MRALILFHCCPVVHMANMSLCRQPYDDKDSDDTLASRPLGPSTIAKKGSLEEPACDLPNIFLVNKLSRH